MQFAKKGTPIRDYFNAHSHVKDIVKKFASDNQLTTSAIYTYINSRRDIRVLNGEIFEIKKLGGKS